MLLEFSVKNYRSISERQTLSLLPVNGKKRGDKNCIKTGSDKIPHLLSSVAILGANAAGKSNIIKAMSTFKEIIEQSLRKNPNEELPYYPFLLEKKWNEQETEFEIVFMLGKIVYEYGFTYTEKEIKTEYLYSRDTSLQRSQQKKLFERKGDNFYFNSDLRGQKKVWQDITRPNTLLLTTAVSLNSEELKVVFDWIDNKLRIISSVDDIPPFLATDYIKESSEAKKHILDILKATDLGIDDIKKEQKELSESELERLPFITQNNSKKFYKVDIKTIHKTIDTKEEIEFELRKHESKGTSVILKLSVPFVDSLKSSAVLIIDELDSFIHPLALKFLINSFHQNTHKKAQLIFTTHNTFVLNNKILERDQVCFVEKDREQKNTTVFKLSDKKGIREQEAFEKNYLAGNYGAIPMIQEYIEID